jgi:hypothetical protein
VGRSVTIATVTGFIAQSFGLTNRVTAAISVAAFTVAILGSYVLQSKPQIGNKLQTSPITPTVLLASILAAVLAGALLRQRSIDSQIVDLGEISDTLQWRLRFCFGDKDCIVNALVALPDRIAHKSNTPPEALFIDQALGEIVRASGTADQLLKHSYGVWDNRFLGTGESLPSASSNFTSQRIPEYLVPNYMDSHDGVLAWKLKPSSIEVNRNLGDLLNSKPMRDDSSVEQTRFRIKNNLNNKDTPSLVRFAMVPDLRRESQNSNYSGCLGLPERRKVFFSDLDYMIKNTSRVIDAAELAGYHFEVNANNQNLYVFMFVPSNSEELVEPTWTNLLIHLKDPTVCQEPLNAH